MADHLDWPFFTAEHRQLARDVDDWAQRVLSDADHADLDATCRALVQRLGQDGWLRYVVPASHGGVGAVLDVRALVLIREILARYDGLADFSFAMQGLGSGSITLFGSDELCERYLPRVGQGQAIAAFALSEPDAGSDVAAIATTARRDGSDFVLDGAKAWISNGGIADFYVVFARTGEAPGAKGLSAFVVDADNPGLTVAERVEVIAPHPLATLRLDACRVPATAMVGAPGTGFKVAMATLDLFRPTVGAAALGFARRAFAEACHRVGERPMFGGVLADMPLAQAKIAEMATEIDASALLVYRAAWTKDAGAERITREASMAKMYATEAAQRVIDAAVQLFGGLGVKRGSKVEELYREIRSLRIYEGATEVHKLIIARQVLGT